MVDEVRREVIKDPLAQDVRSGTPDRSIPIPGLRTVSQDPGNARFQQTMQGLSALGPLQAAAAKVFESQKDDWQTEGKLDFMMGMSEAEALASGNKYTKQGYQALNSVDKGNTFFMNEMLAIDESTYQMSPEQYKSYLLEKRKSTLASLPDDPVVRKMYVAAFENIGPRLQEAHFKAHNEDNRKKSVQGLSDAIYSGGSTNEDASGVMPGSTLRVSPGVVSPAVSFSEEDLDVAALTVLGEAGGEGDMGMAAVAHVLKNRAIDGGYGGTSIKGVAYAPKQFSAWNTGHGGIPGLASRRGSKGYQRARQIVEAVLTGHHQDPTGGATHYYSPPSMALLKKQGAQSHDVPSWYAGKAAENAVTIGNHKFAGKARNLDKYTSKVLAEPASSIAPGTTYYPTDGMDSPYDPRRIAVDESVSAGSVAAEVGVPIEHSPGNSQLSQLIDSTNLRPEDKAEAVTAALVRSLEDGNDQTYNDVGGEAILRKLGATDAQINQVQTAHKAMVQKRQNKFDVAVEQTQEQFLDQIRKGEFSGTQQILETVDRMQDELDQSEQWAQSLSSKAIAEYNQKKQETPTDPQMAVDIGNLYQAQKNLTLDEEQARAKANEIANKYGLDPKDAYNLVERVVALDGQLKDQMRTKAEAEKIKIDKERAFSAQINFAIKNDQYLGGINGTIRVPDHTGNVRELNANEYAVHVITNDAQKNAQAAVAAGQVTKENATVAAVKIAYEKMAKLGIVDKEMGTQMSAAVTGNILNKDGTITEGAKQTFDMYLQMSENPNIGAAYVAKMIENPDARLLLTTAKTLYDGRMDIENSLRRAQELIAQKVDVTQKIEYHDGYQAQIGAGIDEAMHNLTGNTLSRYFSFSGNPFSVQEQEQAAGSGNRTKIREDIKRRADAYFLQTPQVDAQVHIKRAIEDFENDAIVVGGNVILGSSSRNQRLDQVMGIQDYGKDSPELAFDMYMNTFGKDYFKEYLTGYASGEDNTFVEGSTAQSTSSLIFGALTQADFTRVRPHYDVQYNSSTGIASIRLWKDESRKELYDKTAYVEVSKVGKFWLDSNKEQPFLSKAWRGFGEGLVDLTKNMDRTSTMRSTLGY